jgi:methylglyoxal reductase
MKSKRLGSDGPEISVIGYGAWEAGGMAWGPNPPEEQVIEAIETAISTGVDWIDTAEVYGGGKSESVVSQVLEDHPDVRVFTKVAPKPAGTGFAAPEVRAAAEQSLERLGRDKIDLFQLHWPSDDVEIEETWEAMAELVSGGLVGLVGVSNFSVELLERCEKIRHVDSLQPEFSALHNEARDDVIAHCEKAGTGVIAYGPLAFGLLTGAFTAETEFSDDDWRSGKHDIDAYDELFAPGVIGKHLEAVDSLKEIASEIDISVGQLALAWVFAQSGVTGAIVGSRSPKHVRENSEAGDVELTSDTLDAIEAVIR